jgi:hypothetical protein
MDEIDGDVSGSRFILSLLACGVFSATGIAFSVLIGPKLFHDGGGSSWIGSGEMWAGVAAIYLAPVGFLSGLLSCMIALIFRSSIATALVLGAVPNLAASLFLFVMANGTSSNSMNASMVVWAGVGFINAALALFVYRVLRRTDR